jgi:hypothetical protein
MPPWFGDVGLSSDGDSFKWLWFAANIPFVSARRVNLDRFEE